MPYCQLPQLSEHAGLSRQAAYNHFAGKERACSPDSSGWGINRARAANQWPVLFRELVLFFVSHFRRQCQSQTSLETAF